MGVSVTPHQMKQQTYQGPVYYNLYHCCKMLRCSPAFIWYDMIIRSLL